MTNRLDNFMNVAAGEIGYYMQPGLATKYGRWYGLPTGAWCAMYLSWVADQSGNADIFPKHAYTPSGAQWFKDRGQWHPGTAGIRRGDIPYFNFPDNLNRIQHVGVVESVGVGFINTIEGNTSGSGSQSNGGNCRRKTRSLNSWIVGYGRPAWGVGGGTAVGRDYLQVGDTGPAVLDMQQRLVKLGFSVGEAGADSDFGEGTKAGLIAFQKFANLVPDGYYGPLSRSNLVGRTNAPVDTRPKNADGSLMLVLDGIRGPGHTGRWQEVMGTKIDFVISKPVSELIKADQRFLNSVVHATHIKNLTGKSSLLVDGDEGRNTIIVRQFWMRNAVNPIHQQNLIGHPLGFDGILGRETNIVHQFTLNNTTSGSGRYGQV